MSCEITERTSNSVVTVVGILSQLFGVNDRWAVIGSANLAIRGEKIQPSDIDIITTPDTADRLAVSISHMACLDFALSTSKTIQSYYATTTVCGMSIDVMADAAILTRNGTWQRLDAWSKSIEYVQTKAGLLPLTTLAFERNVYLLLGDRERVQRIDSTWGTAV